MDDAGGMQNRRKAGEIRQVFDEAPVHGCRSAGGIGELVMAGGLPPGHSLFAQAVGEQQVKVKGRTQEHDPVHAVGESGGKKGRQQAPHGTADESPGTAGTGEFLHARQHGGDGHGGKRGRVQIGNAQADVTFGEHGGDGLCLGGLWSRGKSVQVGNVHGKPTQRRRWFRQVSGERRWRR